MDQRPVFVIVTAEDCGHCTKFKGTMLTDVRSAIQSKGTVRFEHVNLPSMQSSIPSPYPADLKRLTAWFPNFILVSGKSWNQGKKLQGVVFNQDRLNQRSLTEANLLEWIQENQYNLPATTQNITLENEKKTVGGAPVENDVCSTLRFRPKNF